MKRIFGKTVKYVQIFITKATFFKKKTGIN